MTAPLKIDVFSDPVCPWCLVGLARLDKALADLPADVEVDVQHHPYLLDADAPVEGEDVVEMLKRKYGKAPDEMWDRLEQEARASGVAVDMRKQKIRYASQAAQVLIAAARSKGTQHAVAKALSDACYVDAVNIADPDVLVAIAVAHGFEADEARALVTDKQAWQQIEQAAASASQQGVQGVPFFVFGNKYALSGAQPEQVFGEVIETVRAETAEA